MDIGAGMLPAMTSLVDRLLPEALWQRIQPLLLPPPPRPRGGVPRRVPDRNCVAALIFMARTSTPWALLPAKELGCAPRPPAGGGWTSGPAPGCSISFRRCCWTSSARPAASTWPAQASTRSACARSKGPDRRKPGRSRQGRVQAPPSQRRGRAALVGGDQRGQRQRRHDVRSGAGRHPTDLDAHWSATSSARARSTLIRPTIIAAATPICADVASARGSPGA
jgi:hypothetical protein